MMKRAIVSILILAAGAGGWCALRSSTATRQRQAVALQEADATQTQLCSDARRELEELTEHLRELRAQQPAEGAGGADTAAPSGIAPSGDFRHPGPAEAERLLAELGFDWNSTGDYVVVSKTSLHAIQMEGMKGYRLTDTACNVLAITPAERAAIEAQAQQVGDDFNSWAVAHAQRTEPAGDIVANYTLPADDAFGSSLSNSFVGAVTATLGDERGGLLQEHAYEWMANLGMFGGKPTTMVVKRYQSGGAPRLGFELQHNGGTMSTDVSPRQPFPEAFRPLFPGGWVELAAREGFELPKEFKK